MKYIGAIGIAIALMFIAIGIDAADYLSLD